MAVSKTLFLFVNLGTPQSPQVSDIKKYLSEFLMDDEVIDIPYLARLLLVRGIIVPFRAKKSAHAYQKIWTKDGSPLLHLSLQFIQKLREESANPELYFACRYGEPSLTHTLEKIYDQKPDHLHIFPLYPQYATSTWLTLEKKVLAFFAKKSFVPKLSIQKPFFNDHRYIESLAGTIKNQLKDNHHLLFSFHGIPQSQCQKPVREVSCQFQDQCCINKERQENYCYRSHCSWTAHLTAEALKLKKEQWSFAFQSRLGRNEWLRPYIRDHLQALLSQGIKKLTVVCPSFVVDCLETLEEINISLRHDFLANGGEEFHLIPCLNTHPVWVSAVKSLYKDENQRIELSPDQL